MRLGRHAEVASQLAKEGRRDRALLALRKKKLSEKQLVQLHSLILSVEEMVGSNLGRGCGGVVRVVRPARCVLSARPGPCCCPSLVRVVGSAWSVL